VNVALPSIQEDLGVDETSLAWVVTAYLLSFGGFLLPGGRLGDLVGHRRMFVIGTPLFTEPADRAKAMGVFGFVAAGGGSIGVLLGGVLTDALSRHWVFLVNLPVGVAVVALCLVLLPGGRGQAAGGRLDVAGAVTVTASLMLAVYAIVNGNEAGWTSGRTLGLPAGAAAPLAAFLVIEARVASPLMPLGIFRLRDVAAANAVGILWAAAMFAGSAWPSSRPTSSWAPSRSACRLASSCASASGCRWRRGCCDRPPGSCSWRARRWAATSRWTSCRA